MNYRFSMEGEALGISTTYESYARLAPARHLTDHAPHNTSGDALVNLQSDVHTHDHHSVELSTTIEYCKSQGCTLETEAVLFFPPAARLSSWSEGELHKDFQTQIRLAIPMSNDSGYEALTQAKIKLENSLKETAKNRTWHNLIDLKSNNATTVEFITACRNLAAVFAEILSNKTNEHTKCITNALYVGSSTQTSTILCRLKIDIIKIQSDILSLRNLWRDASENHNCLAIQLLAEHTSHLYVRYLGKMSQLLSNHSLNDQINEIKNYIRDRAQEEKIYQVRNKFNLDQLDHETLGLHLGTLKKFFQSSLYFQVTSQKRLQTYGETAAVAGAGLAAVAAFYLESLGRGTGNTITAQSSIVMSFGVFLYVLRDRLKDRFKSSLITEARRFIADAEQTLSVNGKRMGFSRSWLKKDVKSSLHPNILKLRDQAGLFNIEHAITEDILKLRHIVHTEPTNAQPALLLSGLRLGIRINLERYLKNLDDPDKDFYCLDDDAAVQKIKSKKVYNVYLYIKQKTQYNRKSSMVDKKNQQSIQHIYRLTIDKVGIKKVRHVLTESL